MTERPETCIGGTGVKHDYQPRYDLKEPDVMDSFFSRKQEKDKIYVADVCTQCGDVIARKRG